MALIDLSPRPQVPSEGGRLRTPIIVAGLRYVGCEDVPDVLVPPTVHSFSPVPGSTILATDAIEFTVTDDTGFTRIMVSVQYPTEGRPPEVIWCSGTFTTGFTASTRTAIAFDGTTPIEYRYVVTRAGGWTSSPTIKVDAVDIDGAPV